jgi:hypothetical protein
MIKVVGFYLATPTLANYFVALSEAAIVYVAHLGGFFLVQAKVLLYCIKITYYSFYRL